MTCGVLWKSHWSDIWHMASQKSLNFKLNITNTVTWMITGGPLWRCKSMVYLHFPPLNYRLELKWPTNGVVSHSFSGLPCGLWPHVKVKSRGIAKPILWADPADLEAGQDGVTLLHCWCKKTVHRQIWLIQMCQRMCVFIYICTSIYINVCVYV